MSLETDAWENDSVVGSYRESNLTNLDVNGYNPNHPTLRDVIRRRIGVIDYVVLTAKNIFCPD